MSKIADQLTELLKMKEDLVANLNTKGVIASNDETLETLVPKVLAIVQGGSGDLTLIPKNITADGDYYPVNDGADAYSSVSVNILGDNNIVAKYGDLVGTIRLIDMTSFGDLPAHAWHGNDKLNNVTLKSCENIGDSALHQCSKIASLTNDTVIKTLGTYSFSGCNNMVANLTLDDNITEIPNYCFQNCSHLQVNLPNKLESVQINGFSGCGDMVCTELPQTLKFLGNNAFYRCTNLTANIMPIIDTIGNYAFSESGVTFEEIPNGVVLAPYCFRECNGLTNLILKNDGTITNYCFYGCGNLEEVEITGDISSIDRNAFYNDANLKTITIHRTTPPTLQSTSLPSTIETIYVPSSALEAYKSATNWSRFADIMVGIEGE